jgi:hypothetical protein
MPSEQRRYRNLVGADQRMLRCRERRHAKRRLGNALKKLDAAEISDDARLKTCREFRMGDFLVYAKQAEEGWDYWSSGNDARTGNGRMASAPMHGNGRAASAPTGRWPCLGWKSGAVADFCLKSTRFFCRGTLQARRPCQSSS